MEKDNKPSTNGMLRSRFVQILVSHGVVPEPVFGKPILSENRYAVSYEDSGRKIPEWARLKLSPHNTTDMYGIPRASYMVELNPTVDDPQLELDSLIRNHRGADLIIEAVHNVHHISVQNNTNGKGRITRTIKPHQNLYYSTNEPGFSFPEHLGDFRQAVINQLLSGCSHESLHNFKHTIQITKTGKRSEYQYALPADLPEGFLQLVQSVKLDTVGYGNKTIQVTFVISRHEPRVLPFRPRTTKDPKETGIISTYRPFILHAEQGYLEKYLRNGVAELVHFDHPSTTCAEKLSLLNPGEHNNEEANRKWSLDNIVAVHYFDGPYGYIMLVGPRMSDVKEPQQLLAQTTGTHDIMKSTILPQGMEHGTCTPFVYSSIGRGAVDQIVLLELPEHLMVQKSDYSIGGYGPSAHRASIQMTLRTAEEILRNEFGQKVTSVPHPYKSYW